MGGRWRPRGTGRHNNSHRSWMGPSRFILSEESRKDGEAPLLWFCRVINTGTRNLARLWQAGPFCAPGEEKENYPEGPARDPTHSSQWRVK